MNPLHALIIVSLIFGSITVWSWLRAAGNTDQSLYRQALAAAQAQQDTVQYIPPKYASRQLQNAADTPQEANDTAQ